MDNAIFDFKLYLNDIIDKIDPDIHNELWNKLAAIILEYQKLKTIYWECPCGWRIDDVLYLSAKHDFVCPKCKSFTLTLKNL